MAQAAKEAVADVKQTFFSGGPGTTGREVFEGSTATGPGTTQAGASSGAPAQNINYPTGNNSALGGTGSSGLSGGTTTSSTGTGLSGADHGGLSGARSANYDSQSTGLGSGGISSGHQHGSLSSTGTDHTHRPAEGVSTAALGAGAGAAASGHHGHHHGHHGHEHSGSLGSHDTTASQGLSSGSRPAVGATGTTLSTGQEDVKAPVGTDEVGAGAGGVSGSHQHHHHQHAPSSETGVSSGAGARTSATTDKTGSLQQNAHLYEQTGPGGPATTGAAGTDRFDTDKPRSGGLTSGAAVTSPDVPTGEAGSAPKKSGGIMGVLATSDHDFTGNRDRIAKDGAYADTLGRFKSNTDGPGGSALTGREGTAANNPVAQQQAKTSGTDASTLDSGKEPVEAPKKGFMEKVKEALS